MKVPNISEFEEVREEERRVQEITAREQRLNERAQELNAKKQSGLSGEEREAQVAAVLAGEPLPNDTDIDTELKKTLRELTAVQAAKLVAQKQLDAAGKSVAIKICDSLRPDHNKMYKKLCAALTEAHSVWKELHAMKQALWVQGAGLHGLFSPDPDEILESPTDKSSRLAYFMREAAQAGFCKELAQ